MLTYVIGDVHGCFGKLDRLVKHCRAHCDAGTPRFVFIGDYIDRGPDSADVVSYLIAAQTKAPERMVFLRGNHEAMLLEAVKGQDLDLWLLNGGSATLRSYGVSHAADIPADHLIWFNNLRYTISDGKRFFVHAGVEPGIPLDRQPEEAMLWIREPFLSDTRDHGQYVVHGHTPVESGRPDLRRNRLDVDTGACYGGPLTAAVFNEDSIGPFAFISDDGEIVPAPALHELSRR